MHERWTSGRAGAPPPSGGHLLGFLAFSHGWTWTFWGIATLFGTSIWSWPASPFFYIGGAGVLLGGLVMTWWIHGGDGLRDLGRRATDPRRVPLRWWAVVVLFYPLLALAAAAAAYAIGVTTQPWDLAGAAARLIDPVGLLAMIVFVLIIGPLPEEIGWRGFLQDRLQTSWPALTAAVLVGVIWWSWHLPLFVLPGYFDAFGRAAPTPLDFLLNILPAAVLYAWVYNSTGQSVLAVIAFHFMENFTSEFLGLAEAVRPYRLALMIALAVALVLWAGPRELRRDGARLHGRAAR